MKYDETKASSSNGEIIPVHPPLTPEGEPWVYPTEEDMSGPSRLGRVADKM